MERVSRAFLFHEDLSNQDDGASLVESLEHVLWYFPEGAPLEERVKHVGLAQALLSFGDRFRRRRQNDGEPKGHAATARGPSEARVELVRTKHHCHGFLECEPGLWLVFVLSNRQADEQTRQLGWPAPSKRTARDGFAEGVPHVAGGGRSVGASPNYSGSRLRTVVFGRVAGSSGRVSPEKRGLFPPPLGGKFSSAPVVDSGGDIVSGRVVYDGESNWVDETALRAVMTRAYETFALLHGCVQSVLDAPVRVLRGVSGEGTNGDSSSGGGGREVGIISGVDVLRRLADARKRLRRRATRVTDEAPPQASEMELHEAVPKGVAGNLHEERMRREEEELVAEISALLRVSPVEAIRDTLYNFFVGYLPGAGLAQPHFHLDLGYPQSLPMDSYRRQLGQRMRQRVRRRLHSVLANENDAIGGETLDVDIVITLAGGALLLACMDPPAPATIRKPNTNRKLNRTDSESVRLKKTETSLASSGSTLGFNCENDAGASAATATTTSSPGSRDCERDVVLEGRDVSLLLGYFCSVAGTAEGLLKAQAESEAQTEAQADVEGMDGDSSRSSSTRSSVVGEERNAEVSRHTGVYKHPGTDRIGPHDAEKNTDGNPTSSPAAAFSPPDGGGPKALWAALRSGFLHDKDDRGCAGVCDNGDGDGVGPSEEVEEGRKESKGLLCCDGSLAACDGSFSVEDLGGTIRIWAPRLHDILPVGDVDVHDAVPRVAPPVSNMESHDSCSSTVGGRRRQIRVVAYLRGGVCALVAFRERRGPGCKTDDGLIEPALGRGDGYDRASADGFTGPNLGRGVGDKGGDGDGFTEQALGQGDEDGRRSGDGFTEPKLGRCGGDGARSEGARGGECYYYYYRREDACGKEMGWSEAELLHFGRAIETSLSEDPDLAVLEEDANDLYGGHFVDSSTLRSSSPARDGGGVGRNLSKFGFAVGSGNSRRKTPPRERHQRQRSKSGKPLRAVRHRLSPLPTFSAAGLFHHSDGGALARSRRYAVESPLAGLSAHESFPRLSQIVDASDVPSTAAGDMSTSGCSINGSDEGVFVVVDGGRPPSSARAGEKSRKWSHRCLDSTPSECFRREGYGDGPRSRCRSSCGSEDYVLCLGGAFGKANPLRAVMTGKFSPLLEAFVLRGRADGGIEDMKRGGAGGAHELAVLDDVHASVRVQHPGQRSISGAASQTSGSEGVVVVEGSIADSTAGRVARRVDSGVREVGVRTSMSTGNRWVIGRCEGEATGSKGGGDGGGDSVMYATLEAPILSVGDARAAADSMFSGIGVSGSGVRSNGQYHT